MTNFYIELKSENLIPIKIQGVELEELYNVIGVVIISWITLIWCDIDRYKVWGIERSGEWTKTTEVLHADYDIFVDGDKAYAYRMRAVDTNEVYSGRSNKAGITMEGGSLPIPQNITTECGYTWVDLSWDNIPTASGFNIYRDDAYIGASESNTYVDHDLKNGKAYTYKIKAIYNNRESYFSKAVKIITDTPAVTGARYATEQDALRIKNANVGDVILDRHNGTQPGRYPIEHNQHVGTQFELGAGQKILIKGGTYEYLWLDLPDAIGTKENPIIITNYEGQVKFKFDHTTTTTLKDRMIFDGIQNFKVTGKYDPIAKTGDPRFVGHDNGYDFLHDTYGFVADNNWREEADGLGCISGNQTYFEIEYIECRNGGFAAFKIKKDNPADPDIPMDINIHDNFIHDTGGEAFYVGNNNSSNCMQHGIKGRIWNNLMVRTGTEGLQIGNIIGLFAAYNNTLISTNTSWMSPFQNFHFKGNQLEMKEGKFDYIGNFVYGSGMVNLDIRAFNVPCFSPSISNPIRIGKNTLAFANERNMYIFNSTDSITPLLIEENIFHNGINRAGKVYRDSTSTSTDIINNNRDNVHVRNNKYSPGRSFVTGRAAVEDVNNVQQKFVIPKFENSGYHPDFNPLDITIWTSKIGERAGFTTPVRTWKTGAFESLGTVDLCNITENQVIKIDEFDKDNTGSNYWDSLIGIDIRLADVDNEYSNFVIVNLKAVDLIAKTITVSTPSKTQGVLGNVKLTIDKHLAYRTFNYNSANPEISEIVLINSKQYQYKWQGDPLLACGVNPEIDVANGDGTEGIYWRLLTWQKPDGTVSHYPPDNWKVAEGTYYEGQGIDYRSYEFIPEPDMSPVILERKHDF